VIIVDGLKVWANAASRRRGEKERRKRRKGMEEGDERGIAAGRRYLSRLASKTLTDKGTAGCE
jgi:hypothetical protein